MCGFAGLLDTAPARDDAALTALVGRMAETLRARGPDDGGTWTDAAPGIALGFWRLAILDLTPAGHQPMLSACGRYALVFNGEIYNHRDLRAELAASGAVFRCAASSMSAFYDISMGLSCLFFLSLLSFMLFWISRCIQRYAHPLVQS